MLQKLEIYYMKDTQLTWGRELTWLDKQYPDIIEYDVWIVEEINREVENRNEKR